MYTLLFKLVLGTILLFFFEHAAYIKVFNINWCTSFFKRGIKIYIKTAPTCFGV